MNDLDLVVAECPEEPRRDDEGGGGRLRGTLRVQRRGTTLRRGVPLVNPGFAPTTSPPHHPVAPARRARRLPPAAIRPRERRRRRCGS